MALFPAYSAAIEATTSRTDTKVDDSEEWLKNSSFTIDLLGFQNPTTSKDDGNNSPEITEKPVVEEKKAKSKAKKKLKRKKSDQEQDETESLISTKRNREYLTVDRIYHPAAPKYKIKFYINSTRRKYSKKKFKRYFKFILDKDPDKSNSEDETLKKKDLDTLKTARNENFTGFKQEEDMGQTTAFYNKGLAENPHDIDKWLKYIRFQDTVFQFEKTYRKGSIAKGLRVTAERKLSILDKALTHNPDNEQLLRERLNIAVSAYPSDEIQVQLKKLVEKEQGNIILWQGYIEATQCSMSHCNTPAVLQLYNKCLSTLHKLRRTVVLEKSVLEESILRMLYQCGLFLKQSGLFEQLWTLVRLYLELNLSPTDKSKFNISSGFNEKQLVELEEVVLNSQLPLHELWLRVEKLREACHWLPYMGEDACEDPQRLVFPEDVAELIHPITVPENTFKLTATILTLLKIPLLPCRHSTLQELGLDYVPWALDSIETLLSVFFPLHPINLENKHLLKDLMQLAVGPQYLKVLPGQEEYLQFVLFTMKSCSDCLNGNDKMGIIVWYFRFHTLLMILEKEGKVKLSQNFKKKIKSNLKNLLKQEEHRNNLVYYREYALFELESNGFESALKILTTTVSFINKKSLVTIEDIQENAPLLALYRTITELYLKTENGEREALRNLVSFVVSESSNNVTQDSLNEATLRFKHVTIQLLQEHARKLAPIEHFLPDYFTDWIICNGWFIYLTKGAIECGAFLEESLNTIDEKISETTWQKEILYEFYVTILFKHCLDTPGSGIFKLLDDVLLGAIEKYPNNVFLLTVLAKELSINFSSGQPWWKLRSLLLKTGRALPILFLILVAQQQMSQIEESWVDTITGTTFSTNNNYRNRILSLFQRVTKLDICTRRCGLIWRLYLQFVHTYFDPTLCRNVYYTAVEECPWLKALYIDAAIYIPAELAQIQDLLMEKQLRLHVTPEELDILRN